MSYLKAWYVVVAVIVSLIAAGIFLMLLDKGLVIEINSYEVIGVHKYTEGEEPGR